MGDDVSSAQYRRDVTFWTSAQQSSDDEREALIIEHLPLVISIARQYEHLGVPLADLIQEGNLGLLRAREKYDPAKGSRFSGYATYWIRQAILRALPERQRALHVPIYKVEQLPRILRASRELLPLLGRDPTPAQIAERAGLPEELVKELQEVSQEALRLDQRLGEEQTMTLGELLEDGASTPEQAIEEKTKQEQLAYLLSILSREERHIMLMRYGFLQEGEASYDTIASAMKRSKEYVKRAEERAMLKMRRAAYVRRFER